MGAAVAAADVADDADHAPVARCRAAARRRRVAADAAEGALPRPVPLAPRLPGRALARGPLRRVAHGAGARGLLPGLLLVPDGAAVLRRRDEPVLDRRPVGVRAAREDGAVRPLAWPQRGCQIDRLGPGARAWRTRLRRARARRGSARCTARAAWPDPDRGEGGRRRRQAQE